MPKVRKEIVDLILCMDVLAHLAMKAGPLHVDEQKAIDGLIETLRKLSPAVVPVSQSRCEAWPEQEPTLDPAA